MPCLFYCNTVVGLRPALPYLLILSSWRRTDLLHNHLNLWLFLNWPIGWTSRRKMFAFVLLELSSGTLTVLKAGGGSRKDCLLVPAGRSPERGLMVWVPSVCVCVCVSVCVCIRPSAAISQTRQVRFVSKLVQGKHGRSYTCTSIYFAIRFILLFLINFCFIFYH